MPKKVLGPCEIKKILDRVGKEACISVAEPEAFIRGIRLCTDWYEEASKYSTGKFESDQQQHLEMIAKTSRRLEQLLADDLWKSFSHEITDECLRALGRLREKTLRELASSQELDGDRRAYLDNYKKRSAFDWLVDWFLPLVFINGDFKTIPTQAVAGVNSPYLKFAMATVKELGITNNGKAYGRSSFLKAIGGAFSGDVRRTDAAAEDPYKQWRMLLMQRTMKPQPEDSEEYTHVTLNE